MKNFYLIACFLYAATAVGQVGTPITGRLCRWGALQQDDQIMGHYSVTAVPNEELEAEIYTVALFDADLAAIGTKTYPALIEFSVEDVAYNGAHLGVLIQDDGIAKVELLDGTATTVASHSLREVRPGATGLVFAAGDGFLVLQQFPSKANNPSSAVNSQLTYLPTNEAGQGWTQRFGDPKHKLQSTYIDLLEVDDTIALLRVRNEARLGSTAEISSGLQAIDLTTGKPVLNVSLPADEPQLAPQIVGARRYGDEIRVISNTPDYGTKREVYRGTTELLTYNLAGEQIRQHSLDLPANDPSNGMRTEYVVQSVAFMNDGAFSLVAESIRRDKNKLTCLRQLVYGFNDAGEVQAVLPLDREPLTLPAYFLGRGGAGLLGPKMKDQRLAYFLGMHDGPFNHSLSERQGNGLHHYFWDRSFHDFNVDYRGIHAIRYLDGQFEQEYVPLQDTEIAWMSSARAGYFLVIEPQAGSGQLLPRLEKLNF